MIILGGMRCIVPFNCGYVSLSLIYNIVKGQFIGDTMCS